jgi:hypothetical protein
MPGIVMKEDIMDNLHLEALEQFIIRAKQQTYVGGGKIALGFVKK